MSIFYNDYVKVDSGQRRLQREGERQQNGDEESAGVFYSSKMPESLMPTSRFWKNKSENG